MLRQSWWKILGVLILLYAFTAGMLVPLKPGIVGVTPSALKTGDEVMLQVTGYNSNFDRAGENVRAWLKLDDRRALQAARIAVKDARTLELTFRIPDYLPTDKRVRDFSLILDNPVDGASVLPSAVFISQDSINPSRGEMAWENAVIADLHETSGMTFPFRNILSETIRNTYFHVPLWFAMIILFLAAVVQHARYLRTSDPLYDVRSLALTRVGILYGVLGLATGAIWAKNTWGAYWSWDVKQNMTAVALLIYLAYFILRASFEDEERRARISAVYGIFAFATLIPLIYVVPRLTDSLHPGAGGNPALGGEDLDNTMRMIFYPAIIGWTLIGVWMASLSYRADRVRQVLLEKSYFD
jgi:heme exporter protein C